MFYIIKRIEFVLGNFKQIDTGYLLPSLAQRLEYNPYTVLVYQ